MTTIMKKVDGDTMLYVTGKHFIYCLQCVEDVSFLSSARKPLSRAALLLEGDDGSTPFPTLRCHFAFHF